MPADAGRAGPSEARPSESLTARHHASPLHGTPGGRGVDERYIEDAVKSLTLMQLLRVLAEARSGWVHDDSESSSFCPVCQKDQRNQILWAPKAKILDRFKWRCYCGAEGTLWGARGDVLANPTAIDIVVADLTEAGDP